MPGRPRVTSIELLGHRELRNHAFGGMRRTVLATALRTGLPTRERVRARRQVQRLHDAGAGVDGTEVTADMEPLVLGRSSVGLRLRDDVVTRLPRGKRDRDHLVSDGERL